MVIGPTDFVFLFLFFLQLHAHHDHDAGLLAHDHETCSLFVSFSFLYFTSNYFRSNKSFLLAIFSNFFADPLVKPF